MMLEAARKYVARGWSVIPIDPSSKRPIIEWKEYQTRKPTEAELQVWFSSDYYNIGIVTGPVSNLAVLDVDEPSAEWVEACLRDGPLPETLKVFTGRGEHAYYQHDPSSHTTAGIYPGIDIRSDGGYVIAPPSIHPTGATYRFEQEDAPLAAWPSWLKRPEKEKREGTVTPISGLGHTQFGRVVLENALTELQSVPKGERNVRLNQTSFKIGQLLSGGELDSDQEENITARLIEIGFNDLDQEGAEATVRGALRSGLQQPWVKEELDVEVLREANVTPLHATQPIASYVRGSTVHTWIEQGRWPGGYLSVLAGQQKVGKGVVATDLVARITQGSAPGTYAGKKSMVIVSSTEDDIATDLYPRLEAAGADLDYVVVWDPTKTMLRQDSLHVLAGEIRRVGAVLVVLDHLADHVPHPEGSEGWQNQDGLVRPVLVGLQNVAKETGAGIVGVLHDRKGFTVGLEAVAGAQAWTAVPRMINRVIKKQIGDGFIKCVGTNMPLAGVAAERHFKIRYRDHKTEKVPTIDWRD